MNVACNDVIPCFEITKHYLGKPFVDYKMFIFIFIFVHDAFCFIQQYIILYLIPAWYKKFFVGILKVVKKHKKKTSENFSAICERVLREYNQTKNRKYFPFKN